MNQNMQDPHRKNDVSLTPLELDQRLAAYEYPDREITVELGTVYVTLETAQGERIRAPYHVATNSSPGPALELCLEIAKIKEWDLCIRGYFVLFFDPVGNFTFSKGWTVTPIAESLARLAWAALQGGQS